MIRRPPRSTHCISSAASDVYKRQADSPVTWMNSVIDGRPVVPRTGYIVEFNALWYNALMFAASILVGDDATKADESAKREAAHYERMADRCQKAFVETFVNEHGYLFDYVTEGKTDWSVRPNMIFAAALDYSPLSQSQRKSCLLYTSPSPRDRTRSRMPSSA